MSLRPQAVLVVRCKLAVLKIPPETLALIRVDCRADFETQKQNTHVQERPVLASRSSAVSVLDNRNGQGIILCAASCIYDFRRNVWI